MTREQAIEWMQRHFFYNGTTSPNVMERFSMDDFPGSSVTTSGTVQSGITFTTAQLSGLGVKQVNYNFPRKLKMSSSTFTDVMVNLVWNGSGWLFTVTGGANPTIANGLNGNRNATLSDGKTMNLLKSIEFVYNHDLDCVSHKHGYGTIKCGHRAVPLNVLAALNIPSGDSVQMVLLKRYGRHDNGASQPSGAGSVPHRDVGYNIYEDSSRMQGWPAFSDNVQQVQLRKNSNYDVNHDYRDSNIYINEDTEYIKLRAPIYPNYDYASALNSQQKVPGYTLSPCGTVPWPRMSVVNDGGFQGVSPCAGQGSGRGVPQGMASPCCPVLCGLDFYGAPFSLTGMMDDLSLPYIFGGQGNMNVDASPDFYDGEWREYTYSHTCRVDVNLTQDEFSLEMPCAIKSMAAYDFSKLCYNAGETDGDSYGGDAFKTYKEGGKRHPNFERYYYTVGLIFKSDRTILFLLPDSVRGIDKDDMPRIIGSNQIDGFATNQLGLDHLYVIQGGISIHQIYAGSGTPYVVQVNHHFDSGPSITHAFGGGHGVPQNLGGMFKNHVAPDSPGYNHFKVPIVPGQGGGWKIIARYSTGAYSLITPYAYNGYGQVTIPYNNLQTLAFALFPKGYINQL